MKKTTMKDIADIVGVSKATVSMVLNKKDGSIGEETKNKILKIAKEMNYIPNSIARSLSTKKSGTIGIILPDITNPFFSEIARAIEDAANRYEYNVIFCNTDNDIEKEDKYIELLISKLVDGVLFIAGGKSNKSVKKLESNGIPFVLIDRYIDEYDKYYGVYCLNKDGIIDGVEYLIKKGKKKIVFVTGPRNIEISKLRLSGYEEVMKKHRLYNSDLVFESDFTLEGGMQITGKILDEIKDFDAIFYSNDIMAFGGMKILTRNGFKISQDVSVMGFDNIRNSQIIEPELSTIGQPIYDMGGTACRLLIEQIDEKEIVEKVIYFKTELIIRGTT